MCYIGKDRTGQKTSEAVLTFPAFFRDMSLISANS
jgi:hypothetical protein